MLRIGIVAGEASGDYLAADLIRSMRDLYPDLTVEGIGGPQLQAVGCEILFPLDHLAVMGLTEVAGKYFQLLRIRSQLADHFKKSPPDVFIGVDAPDFNIGLEKVLRASGIKTVHYVSPSVWAWRKYRIKKIKQSVDLILTLFPFEEEFYQKQDVPVAYVGHPLADQIDLEIDKPKWRHSLELSTDKKIIAVMPGSRRTEINMILPGFLRTLSWCFKNRNDLMFVAGVLNEDARSTIIHYQKKLGLSDLPLQIYINKTQEILAAADAALLTSGTITLEAMLNKLPMVVAYRMNWFSYRVIRAMVNVEFAAIPNLLAGKRLVSEFLQNTCQPEAMGNELLRLLEDSNDVNILRKEFQSLHRRLRQNASHRAANLIQSHFEFS